MAANQSNPQVSPDETAKYFERQHRLDAILSQAGLDALVLNPGPSLVYFNRAAIPSDGKTCASLLYSWQTHHPGNPPTRSCENQQPSLSRAGAHLW